jgi:hypothetical protein
MEKRKKEKKKQTLLEMEKYVDAGTIQTKSLESSGHIYTAASPSSTIMVRTRMPLLSI